MPFYKIPRNNPTNISARHPLYGFGAMVQSAAKQASTIRAPEGSHYVQEGLDPFDFDYRMIDRRYYNAVQGYGLTASEAWDKGKEPALRGVLAGLVAYGIAKAVGVEASKAKKVGFVTAVVDAAVGFATRALLEGATAPAEGVVAPPAQPVKTLAAGVIKV
ncbi:MAG: hypothetical protein JRD89_17255 [Deltaproteobacteria bacterium]|nr:hypothetical protein [Deltaproteobacteria bacterium]